MEQGKNPNTQGRRYTQMAKNGYIGKIPNSGNMDVKAPNQVTQPKKGKVIRGKDLRTGKTGK